MKVLEVEPRSDPLWLKLLRRRGGSVFQAPPWLRVLEETYQFDVSALVAVDEADEPSGGLCFSRVADLRGERLVSLPFSDYCDPLVSNAEEWNALIGKLTELGLPIDLRCVECPHPRQDPRFSVVKTAVWHGLDVQDDPEAIWAGFHESARRAVRRATRSGVQTTIANEPEMLRRFFDLHIGVRKRKYRLLGQPLGFFESIWRNFLEPGRGALILADRGGEVIGGTLYLEWNGSLYYKFNASDPAHLEHRPNDLLIWEGVKHAGARGCRQLDFGLSDANQEGLLRFKRKFATHQREIVFLRHVPETWRRRSQDVDEMLTSLTSLLTKDSVPDDVTAEAGNILYRLFA